MERSSFEEKRDRLKKKSLKTKFEPTYKLKNGEIYTKHKGKYVKTKFIGELVKSIDISSYNYEQLERLLLGNTDNVDTSQEISIWLPETDGELQPIYESSRNALFLDNLNKRHIESIGPIQTKLENLKLHEDEKCPVPILGMILVGLTEDNFKILPEGLKKLFEPIWLDIEVDHHHGLLKYKDKEAEVEPIVLRLYGLLDSKKDSLVTRAEIYNFLWGDKKSDDAPMESQITVHIHSLKDALEKLGLKREIIETIREGRKKEGGYIYHNNLSHFQI